MRVHKKKWWGCQKYIAWGKNWWRNKHFKINRSEVEEYYDRKVLNDDPTYIIPPSILEWPAHGDQTQGQDEFLAPFYDSNGNGLYEPYDGDYPDYNITGTNDNANKPKKRSTLKTKIAPVEIKILRNIILSIPVLINILQPSMSMIPLVMRSPVWTLSW